MAIETGIDGGAEAWSVSEAIDWDRVYGEQLPRVYNFFRYRVGNDSTAEELTSRTFEKAWRSRRRYRHDLAAFATWLLRIARNVAIDHLRAERRYMPLEAAGELTDGHTPEHAKIRESDIERLTRLVEDMPDREQEVLALKYGAEATNRRIAELTGLSESNVGTILHRAVETLRKLW